MRTATTSLHRTARECVWVFTALIALGVGSAAAHYGPGALVITAATAISGIILGLVLSLSLEVRE